MSCKGENTAFVKGDDIITEDGNGKKAVSDELFDWIESILFSIFAVMLVFTFIMRTADVKGYSMLPTLDEKDKLIISKLFYEPKNSDIVIVDEIEENLVKRIIATEGQKIDIDFENGKVFVDEIEQNEPYINELTKRDLGGFSYPVIVPKDSVFVMGDNRNHSRDSRDASIGFVPKQDIMGRVIFRIYPIKKIGVVK